MIGRRRRLYDNLLRGSLRNNNFAYNTAAYYEYRIGTGITRIGYGGNGDRSVVTTRRRRDG